MSSKDITVGKATSDDVDAIAQFNIAMANETEDLALDRSTVRAGVRGVLNANDSGFYLVARSGHQAIGSLLITYEWSDWRNGNLWWIQSVYVVPSSRGQGIFRLLYEKVVSLAKSANGVRGIRLYVEKDNLNAQTVYQRLGMSETAYRVFETMF
ncbi:MAG TPA: GNAT family N-acetyltransferase [Gammaproteobacteria bacterium]|jgi:ribosomal protein S18 acetylase RimI-like enzyme|nr:GNAT family N-acetyltransferase [Acidiferrobacteraceae bacterium]HCX87483.1 GNAT family N-acetyltransferase [Gammaproteobacteria bacterium]|tara:strand:- start:1004 stop:1465 length:462 start_codon:yes stop_codon:yes gene_type:complete